MRCTLKPLSSSTTHIAAEEALVSTLYRRYGRPTRASQPTEDNIMSYRRQGQWQWSDEHARLDVKSKFNSSAMISKHLPIESELVLDNRSAAHLALVARIENQLDQRLKARERLERAREEKLIREERERLDRTRQELENDL